MVIGIDIRVLGNKTKSGIEEYTENLLAHLLPLDKNIKFKLFFSSFNSQLPDYEWLHLPNVELYKFKIPNKLFFLSSSLFNFPKIDKLMGGVNIFFSPHFFLTSLSSSCKRVTTFHDLSFVHFPEFFSWRKNIWHNLEMAPKWQAKFSDQIIAVSESTKKDLINLYGIDPAKIEIIYSGISPLIKRPSEEKLLEFRKENNLPERFILFLGKLEPRKNIVGIIKAFNILKRDKRFNNIYLVLAGSRGWLYKDIFQEIEKSEFKKEIIIKNYISDEARAFYYSLADVFIYPSFFEGFGFPSLEAMACGTPVVVSNNSSLPEIVGNGELLVQPNNIQEIAKSIMLILTDNELRDRLSCFGLQRSAKFNWHKTAEYTLKYIKE